MKRALALLVVALASSAIACDGRPKTEAATTPAKEPHSGPAIAVLDLSDGAPEKDAVGFLGVSTRRVSFDRLLRAIDAVAKDEDARGIFVRLGGGSFGIARAEEIGDRLEPLRRAGKVVYCHADDFGNAVLYAAARACTKIYVSPAGGVDAVGIAAQLIYFHKLLTEQLHLSVDILQVGKFKGAEEPFTRDGPSDEARESLEGVLADMRATWLAGISEGRGGEAFGAAAEDGPYSPGKAKERGLIDEVGYADDALDAEKKATGAVREETRFGQSAKDDGGGDLEGLVKVLSGGAAGGARVALIRASGSIAMSSGGGIMGGQAGITEHEMAKLLARVERDESVHALVIRVDSPGGSALASDLIWHRIMKVRAKKPVVISVGDMAASGGYYISSAANEIVAEPTSIVGSIGVVGGKIAGGDAIERIGVHAETFPANKGSASAANRAAYLSPLASWDDATRARVLEGMTGVYDLFLARIAEGRKTTVDKISPFAEGRIFTGKQAKEHALVDSLGGLTEAIARARTLAKLPEDSAVAVFSSAPSWLDALGSPDDAAEESARAAEASSTWGAAARAIDRAMPGAVVFVTSLEALGEGERAVAAVPFALSVR